ncbi:uncharacterized protein LOC131432959 isoform X1 [Malaya genurostris]|uniref:uncharacterized protein LOC131432959 isoform X1 n=2 Tax=Malaya genurostris TaxID=325434 RepID=UPI0026F3C28B|nr:uncharacterized protein LOC131432959 isoform X1 [Malaya genurostris]
MSEVKACVVVGCGANSEICPYLFFLKVPQNPERRVDWCDAMGIATRKGRLYCCTRHFDIPGDFDGDAPSDKSSGIRLKLKGDVLPHKGIPLQHEVRNIYAMFDQMKIHGKIEKNFKYLLPALEKDLQIKVPLNIQQSVLNKTYSLVIEKVSEYFKTDRIKSRYQLVQLLKNNRDTFAEMVNEKFIKSVQQGQITLRTIQPFLQYESYGCLDLPIDHEQLEALYFECDTNQLKAYARQRKTPSKTSVDETNFKHLFYTPGIRVNLTLPFLEMVREVVSNCERFVVTARGATKHTESKPNGLEKFQKVDKPYRLKSAKVGQNLTLEYIDILINLFESYEFMMSQIQRSTLICLLQQIRAELSDYEMKELQVTYGRYLSKHKYYRIINEDIGPDRSEEDNYLYVKEIINPELNFQFLKAIDIDLSSMDSIEEFFRPILGYVNEDAKYMNGEPYLKFADQLKKAITYACQECNTTFDSALARITIQEHRFCGAKKWKCTNCQSSFQENKIASEAWLHECKDDTRI